MEIYGTEIKNFPMVAKTAMGLEDELASELLRLGAKDIKVLKRAVSFVGDKRLLYAANYNLRTAFRVLRLLAEFPVEKEADVYNHTQEIPWHEWMDVQQSFVVDAISFSPLFRNSMFLAQRVKDGVADRFRKETGRRPNVNKDNPDISINIIVTGKKGVLSLDSSGESLHKRGYRIRQGVAVLNEVLAAGMILKSGWHGESHFVDPMCGSGTLPIEAAMYALGIPPGFMRNKYSFLAWKDFDATLYQTVRNFRGMRNRLPVKIVAADRSAVAVRQARMNLQNAGLDTMVKLEIADVRDLIPPSSPGIVMTDPPYGKRMKIRDIQLLYGKLITALNHRFRGYEAWMVTGVPKVLNALELKIRGKYRMNHGGLDVQLVHFTVTGNKSHSDKSTEKRPRRPRIKKNDS